MTWQCELSDCDECAVGGGVDNAGDRVCEGRGDVGVWCVGYTLPFNFAVKNKVY